MTDAPSEGSEYRFVLGKARLRQHAKSRNGCLNCKHRKIKCQETLPSCLNCIRMSLPCEYTSKEQTANTKPAHAATRSTNATINPAVASSAHTWSVSDAPRTGKVIDTEVFSTFAYAYGRGHVLGRNAFLERLVAMDSLSLVLSSTIRTLSLAHISQLHGDQNIAYQARVSYQKTLYHLRHAVEQIASGRSLRYSVELISAIMLIGHYDEAILPSSHSTRQSLARWAPHYDGAQRVMEACHPSSLNLSDSAQTETLRGFWQLAWFLNMAQRKALHAGLKKWRSCGMDRVLPSSPLNEWHELVIPLPELIARLDHILNDHKRKRDGRSILEELLTTRASINDWLSSQLISTPSVATSDAKDFDASIEEQVYISIINPKVTLQYCFSDMQSGMLYVLAMLACCLCDLSILRMKYRSYTSDDEVRNLTTRDIEQDVWTMSIELCRSFRFLSSYETAGFRDTEFEILCFLSRYFLTRDALMENEWCDGCRSALHKRAHRLYRISNRVLNPLSQDIGAFEHYVDWPPV
ncbi:hypothetical protein BDZ85DRAFT_37501 [Elsinoe ampelina]|uniref:Zn(2)-C6 fungal-type domain-containing protein n=1 Tax=Elsinoe ampelina TaxID=302913 RepID=A0A6A6G2M8_9PEZI|nr:hypothetical protein BDZ85DRAFT_37501 [Elsinoe ampelina]